MRNSILLVEDDEDDALLFKRALEVVMKRSALVPGVTRKRNGLEARVALERCKKPDDLPDGIVVDINMPLMDGMSFLRWFRGEPNFERLQVAVLTTSTELTTRVAALDAGADRVFVKPNSFREMLTIASEILQFGVTCRDAGARRGRVARHFNRPRAIDTQRVAMGGASDDAISSKRLEL